MEPWHGVWLKAATGFPLKDGIVNRPVPDGLHEVLRPGPVCDFVLMRSNSRWWISFHAPWGTPRDLPISATRSRPDFHHSSRRVARGLPTRW